MIDRRADSANRGRLLSAILPVLLAGVLADQASKSWASLRAVEPRMIVPGYVAAYAVPNTGITFGYGNERAWTATAFAVFGLACAGLLVRLAVADRGRWGWADHLAGGLLLAGILGNTVDRLALGHVRDFLVTRALPNLVFNVADLLLVVGGVALLMARGGDAMRSRMGRGCQAPGGGASPGGPCGSRRRIATAWASSPRR